VANEAQVKLLKEKGVEAWNDWRKQNPEVRPNLREADLRKAYLSGANLSGANLASANFDEAQLVGANLRSACLDKAAFSWSWLFGVDFRGASLRDAEFIWSDLRMADLSGVHFWMTDLRGSDLSGADLTKARFKNCSMGQTQLGNVDLSQCEGLLTIKHDGPSNIGIDTIYLSGGSIPEAFLRGAGVPEPFIVQMKSLVAAMSPIEFYSCFISYSSKDQEFAERLHADLQSKGVRCWFAPEDLKIGDPLRRSFDEAIRIHDKLMLLLSENSVSSPWVEKEVETAFEKERREKRTVLFPIRLDDAVMETNEAWAADIRRIRHIGDFRDWKNHDSYKKAFERLLRDLKA
jgi:hypothetical protein